MRHKTIITAITILALVAGCAPRWSSESFVFPDQINHLVVKVSSGDVTLTANSGGGAQVYVEVSCRTVVPDYRVYVAGDTLHVEMETGKSGAKACEGLFDIAVPAHASAEVRTGMGNVTVDGISGDSDIISYRGDVTLTDTSGDLEVTAVSGSIQGTGLGDNEFVVSIGAGDLDLEFTAAPTLVDAEIVMGNAALTIPHASYRISAVARGGQVDIRGVEQMASAPSALWLTIESGNIRIRGRGVVGTDHGAPLDSSAEREPVPGL